MGVFFKELHFSRRELALYENWSISELLTVDMVVVTATLAIHKQLCLGNLIQRKRTLFQGICYDGVAMLLMYFCFLLFSRGL